MTDEQTPKGEAGGVAMVAEGQTLAALINLILVLADNKYFLGRRLSEWAPGGPSLEELVADTDDGVLMGNNKSWSIDDLRLNFQFGCELAWEVKRGKRTRILKNPLYGGTTPRFWSACDAVGGPEAFRMWGLLSCGKGDPMQLMAVGHGCPPARFRGRRSRRCWPPTAPVWIPPRAVRRRTPRPRGPERTTGSRPTG